MSMTDTPQSCRLHILLLGRRNSGKSSLINALTGQDVALVSDTPGTTTDPVLKAMEIQGIGPCLFIDTPGFDDEGILGERRVERTMKAVESADIALLLCAPDMKDEQLWLQRLSEKKIPVIPLLNKVDILKDVSFVQDEIASACGKRPIAVSALQLTGLAEIKEAILAHIPEDYGLQSITSHLVSEGDTVLLVMPQDNQAPRGRLILPQVQTIRDLLDKRCIVVSCTTEKIDTALAALSAPPALIITDSQAFNIVYDKKPVESRLTSFSILFAAYKGDIDYYVKSVKAIDRLTPQSRVLIAEACTHAPESEDIGREKIPRLLRRRVGQSLTINIVSGKDFPNDLSYYDLVIQCGACMFNRRFVLNRVGKARSQNVPVTNYGIVIAYLQGILDKISI